MSSARVVTLAMLTIAAAPAATAQSGVIGGGPDDLALAAIVGLHEDIPENQRNVLAAFLNSEPDKAMAIQQFQVKAESVFCATTNIDITRWTCNLKSDGVTKAFVGRPAHELYATLVENGVPVSAGAGQLQLLINDVRCTINPAQIKEKAGGGAECKFKKSD